MKTGRSGWRRSPLWLAVWLSGMAIAACAPATQQMAVPSAVENAAGRAAESQSADNLSMPAAAPPALEQSSAAKVVAPGVAQTQPQLVKTAEMSLTVASVATGIQRVTAIARQQQGDIVGLQDQAPTDPRQNHTALIQVRVPQRNLEPTLKALGELGSVERQTLAAQDVSNQLVDFQARLKNLRNTEATLLRIMNRSGSVGDVLKVAQELSTVRNEIEQIDAQVKNLQNQVAYSTVTVSLSEAIASLPPQQPLAVQMSDTWQQAGHSMAGFTVGVLKLLLWLLVYSPYWGTLAIAAALLYRRLQRSPQPPATPTTEPPTSVS